MYRTGKRTIKGKIGEDINEDKGGCHMEGQATVKAMNEDEINVTDYKIGRRDVVL